MCRWPRKARGVCGVGSAGRGGGGSSFPACQVTFPGAEALVGLGSQREEGEGSLQAPALNTPNHRPHKGHLVCPTDRLWVPLDTSVPLRSEALFWAMHLTGTRAYSDLGRWGVWTPVQPGGLPPQPPAPG